MFRPGSKLLARYGSQGPAFRQRKSAGRRPTRFVRREEPAIFAGENPFEWRCDHREHQASSAPREFPRGRKHIPFFRRGTVVPLPPSSPGPELSGWRRDTAVRRRAELQGCRRGVDGRAARLKRGVRARFCVVLGVGEAEWGFRDKGGARAWSCSWSSRATRSAPPMAGGKVSASRRASCRGWRCSISACPGSTDTSWRASSASSRGGRGCFSSPSPAGGPTRTTSEGALEALAAAGDEGLLFRCRDIVAPHHARFARPDRPRTVLRITSTRAGPRPATRASLGPSSPPAPDRSAAKTPGAAEPARAAATGSPLWGGPAGRVAGPLLPPRRARSGTPWARPSVGRGPAVDSALPRASRVLPPAVKSGAPAIVSEPLPSPRTPRKSVTGGDNWRTSEIYRLRPTRSTSALDFCANSTVAASRRAASQKSRSALIASRRMPFAVKTRSSGPASFFTAAVSPCFSQ